MRTRSPRLPYSTRSRLTHSSGAAIWKERKLNCGRCSRSLRTTPNISARWAASWACGKSWMNPAAVSRERSKSIRMIGPRAGTWRPISSRQATSTPLGEISKWFCGRTRKTRPRCSYWVWLPRNWATTRLPSGGSRQCLIWFANGRSPWQPWLARITAPAPEKMRGRRWPRWIPHGREVKVYS